MKQMWDERYGADEFAYGKEPNDFLRAQVDRLPEGDVLLLAEGEGRNAVFVAEHRRNLEIHGRVVAVDLSEKGTEKTLKLAAERGVEVEAITADLAEYTIGEGCWAAIVSIWGHMPPPIRKQVHAAAVKGICSGGVFLLEAYRPEQLEFRTGGPPVEAMMMTRAGLEQELAGLNFEILEDVERHVSEGAHHDGVSATVQVLGVKP